MEKIQFLFMCTFIFLAFLIITPLNAQGRVNTRENSGKFPSNRFGHAMVHVKNQQKVIMFGGARWDNTNYDTLRALRGVFYVVFS